MKSPIELAMFSVFLVVFGASAQASDFECGRNQSNTACVKAAVIASTALQAKLREISIEIDGRATVDLAGRFSFREIYVFGDGDWISRQYVAVLPLENPQFTKALMFNVTVESEVDTEDGRIKNRTVTGISSIERKL